MFCYSDIKIRCCTPQEIAPLCRHFSCTVLKPVLPWFDFTFSIPSVKAVRSQARIGAALRVSHLLPQSKSVPWAHIWPTSASVHVPHLRCLKTTPISLRNLPFFWGSLAARMYSSWRKGETQVPNGASRLFSCAPRPHQASGWGSLPSLHTELPGLSSAFCSLTYLFLAPNQLFMQYKGSFPYNPWPLLPCLLVCWLSCF